MQFELQHQKCKLANFNARAELNGEDRVPAADLRLETVIGLGDLAQFGPELRACFYDESNGGARLRNPKLTAPFDFHDECVGACVTVHHGLGGSSDLDMQTCKVNAFKLWPLDGGTIILSFRIQAHPNDKQAGKLCAMIQSDIEVTVAPAQASLDLGGQK